MKNTRWWNVKTLTCPVCDVTWHSRKNKCWSCSERGCAYLKKIPARLVKVIKAN